MKIGAMIRNTLLAMVAVGAVMAGVVFFYRYQIMQYSADALIRRSLPGYIKVENILFEPDDKRLVLRGFRILNPPGFLGKYLLEVREVICAYKMRGDKILDGIDIVEPILEGPVFTVERRADGALNLVHMPQYIQSLTEKDAASAQAKKSAFSEKAGAISREVAKRVQAAAGNKALSDIVKLPEIFIVRKGRLVFIDRKLSSKAHIISIDDIEAEMSLRLDRTYTRVLRAGSSGRGILDGETDQAVEWNSVYDPTTPRLSMGNRFVVSGLDILTFKPYYDRLSPFDFKRGRFSGTLVFDFDNGNIGSTNEIRLSNLAFSVKRGFEDAAVWGTPVKDLAKYFTSPQGDIVFDFKLKGDMSNPKFDLGPISKRAITSMAVDKVSQVLQTVADQTQKAAQPGESADGKETDVQKAAKYIGILSDMMSKQKQN